MFRFKILQMRVEHPKEKIDIVGRLRNFENALVCLLVRRSESVPWRIGKSDPQSQFLCDEIDRTQPQRELLQKAAQHEEERLGGFDFVFELEALVERFRRLNKFEQPIRLPIRSFPKPD